MRLLITGTAGQLVQNLVTRAGEVAPDLDMVCAGRPDLDLERLGTIHSAVAAAAPDVVINAAAYTAVDQAEDDPERCNLVNGEAAGRVAEAARQAGARIIQISTDYVFDGAGGAPYRESAAVNPINVYGRSKLIGEQRVREATPDHLIVRTSWVYSAIGNNFVKTMLRVAHGPQPVRVVDDQFGCPTAAFDIADGLIACLRQWASGSRQGLGEVLHLAGGGDGASWHQFAQLIFAEAERHGITAAPLIGVDTSEWPTRAVRPADTRLDSRRFGELFGYSCPDWRQSTSQVVDQLVNRATA